MTISLVNIRSEQRIPNGGLPQIAAGRDFTSIHKDLNELPSTLARWKQKERYSRVQTLANEALTLVMNPPQAVGAGAAINPNSNGRQVFEKLNQELKNRMNDPQIESITDCKTKLKAIKHKIGNLQTTRDAYKKEIKDLPQNSVTANAERFAASAAFHIKKVMPAALGNSMPDPEATWYDNKPDIQIMTGDDAFRYLLSLCSQEGTGERAAAIRKAKSDFQIELILRIARRPQDQAYDPAYVLTEARKLADEMYQKTGKEFVDKVPKLGAMQDKIEDLRRELYELQQNVISLLCFGSKESYYSSQTWENYYFSIVEEFSAAGKAFDGLKRLEGQMGFEAISEDYAQATENVFTLTRLQAIFQKNMRSWGGGLLVGGVLDLAMVGLGGTGLKLPPGFVGHCALPLIGLAVGVLGPFVWDKVSQDNVL
ncbi:MAG TPA: hypothetical protein VLE95_03370 [Chlamydiales bacterium]|nr:hypothetical protein [Chlamydiales bacterium]